MKASNALGRLPELALRERRKGLAQQLPPVTDILRGSLVERYVTAALRLLARLPELYGSRFFDILLLDALYAQAPVLQLAEKIGWDLIISLKQNQRDLYQSAVRLFASRPADASGSEQQAGKTYQFQLWDTDGLPFSADHPQPVRVVRSEEKLTQNHYRRGVLVAETTEHEWLWFTTLRDAQAFPTALVRRLGHGRWKQENNGWNDLTQNWAII